MSKSLVSKRLSIGRQAYQPLFATIELNQNCNYKCLHCYNYDRSKLQKQNSTESLSDQEVLDAIDQFAELGTLFLAFTGGEPLLHKSILSFVQHSKRNACFTKIKSNGSLLSKELAQKLYDVGLDSLDISLYGATEESYVNLTGYRNLEKTLSGIKNALKVGIEVNVSIILTRTNAHELNQMIAICKQNQWNFQISDEVTDRYDSTSAQKDLGLSPVQYKELLEGEFGDFFNIKNPHKNLQCGCAKSVCGLTCTGEVYPCIGAPIPSGNIRKALLKNIWRHSPELNRIRELKEKDFKSCQNCKLIEHCSRSSGSAHINTGDYLGCDPEAHKKALIRYEFYK